MSKVKFVDLFAGLGGIRLGFEQAFNEMGFETKCVLTSEIKPYAQTLGTYIFDNMHANLRWICFNSLFGADIMRGVPSAFNTLNVVYMLSGFTL